MTAIERYEAPPRASLAEKVRYAEQLATSDLLPAAYRKRPGNVLLAIEYGDMLGCHPLTAVTHIHVIDGKPTQSAELMRASVRNAGHRFRVLESTAQRAEVQIVRHDDPEWPFSTTFDMDDARTAGLLNKKGGSWDKYPTAMLLARATSACVRMACPEVLMGISYVPEELGVAVDENGDPLVTKVDAVRVDGPEWASQDVVDEIYARAKTLSEEQRAVMAAWREAEGISLTSGPITIDQARACLAQLDQIVGVTDSPGGDPDRSGGVAGSTPAPATVTPTPPNPDDEIVDAELVDDEPVGAGAAVPASPPQPAPTPPPTTAPMPASSRGAAPGSGRAKGAGTPQGAYFARHEKAAVACGLTTDELRERLAWIATDGAATSAEGWGTHSQQWLAMNRLLDAVLDEHARPDPHPDGEGWALVYGATA